MTSALITGINGQDGSYLAEYLLSKGYDVFGVIKRNSIVESQTLRIDHLYPEIRENLFHGDLCDFASLLKVLEKVKPDEVYNLGAQSHVKVSFDQPIYTVDTIVNGTMNLLELIRMLYPKTKYYQASSSEMFGNSIDSDGFQRETTPMKPESPYACAKLCAHHLVGAYRSSYKIFGSCGILFNHESVRRGSSFVTTKVVRGAIDIKRGHKDELVLGNLESRRDWGHAQDYVEMMWSILQLDTPDDFICATGVSHSIRELCEHVFSRLGMNYEDHVRVDSRYFRPSEVHDLRGCSEKLLKRIDFRPKYDFASMLDEMIDYWMQNSSRQRPYTVVGTV